LGSYANSALVYGIKITGTGKVENTIATNITANTSGVNRTRVIYLAGKFDFINNSYNTIQKINAINYFLMINGSGLTCKAIGNRMRADYDDSFDFVFFQTTATSDKIFVCYNDMSSLQTLWGIVDTDIIYSGNKCTDASVYSFLGTGNEENFYANNNYFDNSSFLSVRVNGTAVVENNMFFNDSFLDSGAEVVSLSAINNFFYECNDATFGAINLNASATGVTFNKNIINNSTLAPATGVTLTLTNSLYYGNTIGGAGTVTWTTSLSADPLLLAPESGSAAWEVTSPIEDPTYAAYAWRDFLPALINLDGATYTGAFKFINFTGAANFALARTGTATLDVQYCSVSDFCVGVIVEEALTSIKNTIISDIDGFAILNYADPETTISVIKNNIITDTYTAIFLRAAADVQYNTATQNDYGLYSNIIGFLEIEEYAKDYIAVMNNIFFNNNSWDYSSPKLSDYNIIGSREYPLSAGDNDISENPQLDSNYYPATVYTGYKRNSPAYLGASDANKHIGARNEQHIAATLTYTAFTFVDNPINFTQELEPVNAQATMSVAGVYEGVVDAFVAAFNMEWTEDTITDSAQKQAIELIKKTTWILGLSFDGGTTWGYYKVEIDGVLSTRQPVYLIQEVPYGSYSIRVREIPGFDITNYEVDAL
jgi:hypothetical protein